MTNLLAKEDFDAARALLSFDSNAPNLFNLRPNTLNCLNHSMINPLSPSVVNLPADISVAKRPEFNRWTQEDDERLTKAVGIYGEHNWKTVSLYVETKDKLQCRQRWQKVIRPGIKKGKWTEEEDATLTKIVHASRAMGITNWRHISDKIPHRTSKQCRERWNHHLSPNVNKTSFTPEEDEKLKVLLVKHGTKWSKIAKELPGRTENSVRARYQGLKNIQLNEPYPEDNSDTTKVTTSLKMDTIFAYQPLMYVSMDTFQQQSWQFMQAMSQNLQLQMNICRHPTIDNFVPMVNEFSHTINNANMTNMANIITNTTIPQSSSS